MLKIKRDVSNGDVGVAKGAQSCSRYSRERFRKPTISFQKLWRCCHRMTRDMEVQYGTDVVISKLATAVHVHTCLMCCEPCAVIETWTHL